MLIKFTKGNPFKGCCDMCALVILLRLINKLFFYRENCKCPLLSLCFPIDVPSLQRNDFLCFFSSFTVLPPFTVNPQNSSFERSQKLPQVLKVD